MSLFNISWNKHRDDHTPVKLRQSKVRAWLRAINSPISSLYGLFRQNRDKNLYKLSHRQHQAHVQAVLNDKYDPGLRRIIIEDAPASYEPTIFYQDIENKPVYLYKLSEDKPIYLYTEDESEFGGIDFVLKIPESIPYNLNEMKALLSEYKKPGAAYIIQEI